MIKVTLERARETKGTMMYTEQGVPINHKIGNMYVKKQALLDAFTGKFPDYIVVTVERKD